MLKKWGDVSLTPCWSCESRLEPGEMVEVEDYDGEMYVVRHAPDADSDKIPSLPRPSHE